MAFSSPLSVVESNYKWDKSSLRVCWSNDTKYIDGKSLLKELKNIELYFLNNEDRKILQNKIQEEYSLSKVGIEFTGWGECNEEADFDIALIGTQENPESKPDNSDVVPGQARIGLKLRSGKAATSQEKGYIFLRKLLPVSDFKVTPLQNLLITSVHEFGHAAGLRHEHIRPEAALDPNCLILIKKEIFQDMQSESISTATMIGAYDSESIMNYCYERALRRRDLKSDNEIKLSAGDIKSLRCIYLADEEPLDSCRQTNFAIKPLKLNLDLINFVPTGTASRNLFLQTPRLED